jgi:hypothetical protein
VLARARLLPARNSAHCVERRLHEPASAVEVGVAFQGHAKQVHALQRCPYRLVLVQRRTQREFAVGRAFQRPQAEEGEGVSCELREP